MFAYVSIGVEHKTLTEGLRRFAAGTHPDLNANKYLDSSSCMQPPVISLKIPQPLHTDVLSQSLIATLPLCLRYSLSRTLPSLMIIDHTPSCLTYPLGEDGVDYTWHPEHTNGVLKEGETESLDSTKRVYFKAPMPKHLISAWQCGQEIIGSGV